MKSKVIAGLAAVAVWLVCGATGARAGWTVDIESGLAYNGYNDVRIPGDLGTDISLTEDLKSDGTAFLRLRLTADLGRRHQLSILAAPLRFDASGRIDRAVDYNGVSFAAGEILTSRYRFDSYRLTYRYALARSERLRFDLGLTAKIRDAAIAISGQTESSEKTNTGFVPLINFAL
ncbi:MAG: hypothetical protein KKA42_06285, partial [candidate division Zixibacteria bacterium]|nr:hypothetical protein [candidate division Zixibacteria bacterium]